MSSEKKYINSDFQSFFENNLSSSDPEIYKAINDELLRQQQHIELIASENIVSKAVLEAQGTILTNKYAEGYSGKRYYGGCEHVDVVEDICIERIKKLFNYWEDIFCLYVYVTLFNHFIFSFFEECKIKKKYI